MTTVRSIMSHPAADSLWAATAQKAEPAPPITGDSHADVLVVGGGYTGLSTALPLARTGADVCVLDAPEPGWGASGRIGGQVNQTLKNDPDEPVKPLGSRAAPQVGRKRARRGKRV